MADQFYFTKDDKQFGPFTPAQLKKLAEAGRLQPTDKVRKGTMTNWVSAAAVKGLFPAAARPAASPAPAPAPAATPSPLRAPEVPDEEVVEAVLVDEDEGVLGEPEAIIPDEDEPAPRKRRPSASGDLRDILLALVRDPVGNLPAVYTRLGRNRALVAGAGGAVVYVLAFVLYVYLVLPSFLGIMVGLGGADRPSRSRPGAERPKVTTSFDAKILAKSALAAATIPVGMGLASLGGRKLFRSTGGLESDIFLVGMALVPGILNMLLDCFTAGLLGVSLMEFYVAIWLLVFCWSILLLYSGCRGIHQLSPVASTLVVPLILILPLITLDIMTRYVIT